jgi:2',3'-cyclic-nucleotide 2'-phosphodiesterase
VKIACIGDIVGRPGRQMLTTHLSNFVRAQSIDFVIANGENASHGFGLTPTHAHELFQSGVDVITGGNHTWDKKELIPFLSLNDRILRPGNYPQDVPGSGIFRGEIQNEKIAILNLMGHHGMPMVENPFRWIDTIVTSLRQEDYKHIVLDFHAEVTSEKRAIFMFLKGKVSAIFGTHTHVGTDDLCIAEGTGYVTDVGLSGCRDNVIGMDSKVPIERFMSGLPGRFDIPHKCKKILQIVVFELKAGRCVEAKKYKIFNDTHPIQILDSIIEVD